MLSRRTIFVTLSILLTVACHERPRYGSETPEALAGVYAAPPGAADAVYEPMVLGNYEFAENKLFYSENDPETGEVQTDVIGLVEKSGGIAYTLKPAPGFAAVANQREALNTLRPLMTSGLKIRMVVQKGRALLTAGDRTPVMLAKSSRQQLTDQRGKMKLSFKAFNDAKMKFFELAEGKTFAFTKIHIQSRAKRTEQTAAPAAPETAKPDITKPDADKPAERAPEPSEPAAGDSREPAAEERVKKDADPATLPLASRFRRDDRREDRRGGERPRPAPPIDEFSTKMEAEEKVDANSPLLRINPVKLQFIGRDKARINDKHDAVVTYRLLRNGLGERRGQEQHRLVLIIKPQVDGKIYDIEKSTVTFVVAPNPDDAKGFTLVKRRFDGDSRSKNTLYYSPAP